MAREYRVTFHPHFKAMGQYYGRRFFPQFRRRWWIFRGDWQDLARGSAYRYPRGVPTKEQADEYIRDDKLNNSSYEGVL